MGGLEQLEGLRWQLDVLERSGRIGDDEGLRSAVERLRSQVRAGMLDDGSEQCYADVRVVLLALMRLSFELRKQSRLN